MNFLNKARFNTPRPDDGSHPAVAVKPSLQQLAIPKLLAAQLFFPLVTSLVKDLKLRYNVGLTQPREERPAESRSALTSESMLATIDEEA